MIPKPVEEKFISIINLKNNRKDTTLKTTTHLAGGSINNALKLHTNHCDYFLKWNYADKYPLMFEQEEKGLIILDNANQITIPKVIACENVDEYSFLVLEFIEPARQVNNFWNDFGTSLANLHKHSAEKFGLDHDNYIGSLHQSNKQHNNWIDFFIYERLEAQIKLATNERLVPPFMNQKFEKLYKVLNEIFPSEPPALLHGDLWSGNYMTANNGKACLIDPAVYYGHREMDIGMSKLFGGFNDEFYVSYNRAYPLENGWEKRVDVCNLYPLMVHVNLFGGGYLSSVESILRRF